MGKKIKNKNKKNLNDQKKKRKMKIEPVRILSLLTVLFHSIGKVVADETKTASCHFTEDYSDKSKPSFLVDLFQKGADDNPLSFKMQLQVDNMEEHDDHLSMNRFDSADCAGDATTVIDGNIVVKSRFGKSKARYRSFLEETNMCDFRSIQITDMDGAQLGSCNVVLTYGNRRCDDFSYDNVSEDPLSRNLLRGGGDVN